MIVNHIQTVAKDKGKTVRQISEESGLQYNTVLHLFRGQGSRVNLETLDAVCRVLQVQPGNLFQWVPNKHEQEERV